MLNVALYIRVSTQEQAMHGLSVEAQSEALETWAKEKGAFVVGKYIDAGISARKSAASRPELQRLLNDIQRKKIDMIVFTKLDRWFRNIGEYYKVQEILDKYNVAWKTIHEDYDTSTASGRFKVNIMLSVAQDEADRTSERINRVFDSKKLRREVISGSAPLGYKIENKHLVPNEQAYIVKDLFNFFVRGNSAYATQRYLANTHNIHYDVTTVKRLLKNSKYIGSAYGIDNFCEPIIDKNTFQLAQELLAKRAQRTCPSANRTYLFKGLLVCSECKSIMSGCYYKNTYYYRCTKHTYVGNCSFERNIREDTIEQYLLDNILNACKEYNINIKKRLKKPKTDVAAIRRKLERLKDLYIAELITLDEYKNDSLQLKSKIEEAEVVSPAVIDIPIIQNALLAYSSLSREEKRAFWLQIIQKIEIPSFSFTFRNT